MGKLSRDKGAAWERAVAGELEIATDVPCKRSLEETRSGNLGKDIQTELPLSAQCKHGKALRFIEALKEAEAGAEPGDTAIAFVRRTGNAHKPPEEVAVIRMSTALDWISKLHKAGLL